MKNLCLGLFLMVMAMGSYPALAAESVNINVASIKQLAKSLEGVGVRRAAAIYRYRKENGPFESIDDLRQVKGMSMKIIDNNRAIIVLDQ